jgi:hypothetical protein
MKTGLLEAFGLAALAEQIMVVTVHSCRHNHRAPMITPAHTASEKTRAPIHHARITRWSIRPETLPHRRARMGRHGEPGET